MISRLRTGAIVAVSSLALALPVATVSTPAAAQGWHGGGWHGGGGGWHGGGWGGGGWRGGGWRGGGWRGGGWGRPGWGGGGWGWGGPAAVGLASGLALGAIAASAAPAYGYGGCYLQNQPVYDGWGQFAGYQRVRVCY